MTVDYTNKSKPQKKTTKVHPLIFFGVILLVPLVVNLLVRNDSVARFFNEMGMENIIYSGLTLSLAVLVILLFYKDGSNTNYEEYNLIDGIPLKSKRVAVLGSSIEIKHYLFELEDGRCVFIAEDYFKKKPDITKFPNDNFTATFDKTSDEVTKLELHGKYLKPEIALPALDLDRWGKWDYKKWDWVNWKYKDNEFFLENEILNADFDLLLDKLKKYTK